MNAHERADARAVHPRNRSDRTAQFARFTPLSDDDQPMAGVVDVTARVRVSTRWTGDPGPRCNLAVVTVDDRAAGAPLLAHMRWRVETWEEQADERGWLLSVDNLVDVTAALMTPAGVELEGWSLVVKCSYGQSGAATAPPWLAAAGH